MLIMPNYSLRSKYGSEIDRPYQPIGSFPNCDIALDTLNQAGDRKESGHPQFTIGSFTFEDSRLNEIGSIKYYLVETFNGSEVTYPLFPKDHLQFDPMKTTTGKGLFQR